MYQKEIFFITFLLHKNLHSSHAILRNSARRLFWNLCFKRSESWPTSHQTHLETLLFALQTLPQLVRIPDISFTIQFRMLSVISTCTTDNKIYFTGLDFHFYSCASVIVYKNCFLQSMDTSSRRSDQIHVLSVLSTKRCINEAGFKVSTLELWNRILKSLIKVGCPISDFPIF